MKKIILALAVIASFSAFAKDVYVQGHTTKNGAYVEPHHRTAPDNTNTNNYGTQPNYNPYTGATGTIAPNYTPSPPAYVPAPMYRTPVCGYVGGQYLCR